MEGWKYNARLQDPTDDYQCPEDRHFTMLIYNNLVTKESE